MVKLHLRILHSSTSADSLLQVFWISVAILLNTIVPRAWDWSSHLRQLRSGGRIPVVATRQALQTGHGALWLCPSLLAEEAACLQATLQAAKIM